MTKDLPGALREALGRAASERHLAWGANGNPTCESYSFVACPYMPCKRDRELAALSLSSPIEPSEQITKLANFIMAEIDGEPSQSEGAVDCAIRLLSAMNQRIQILERKAQASSEIREHGIRLTAKGRELLEQVVEEERKENPEGVARIEAILALTPSRQGAAKDSGG